MKRAFILFFNFSLAFLAGTESGIATTFSIYTDLTAWQTAVGSAVLDDFSDDTSGRFYSKDFGNFTGTSSNLTELYQPYIYHLSYSDPQTYISFRAGSIVFAFDYGLSAFSFRWRNTSDPYSDLFLNIEGNTWTFHNASGYDGYSFFGVVATGGTFDTITIQINSTRYAQVTEFRYSVPAGDIYYDATVDLKDVITGLQVLVDKQGENIISEGDVDGDGRVGLQEIIYDLKQISEIGN